MNTQRVEGHTPDAWLIDAADAYFATVDSHTAQRHEIERATVTPLYKFSDIERLEKVNEALVRALSSMLDHVKDRTVKEGCVVCDEAHKALALAKEPA